MGKGHRLLKKKKEEKSKVKIKGSATKFLPKGTNVTDTTFKVKQIVIREQLKVSSGSDVVSSRKLNTKELLTRAQHYNSTVRTEAVNGLKELVTIHSSSVIGDNLSQLLNGVAPLVLDKEKTVRREALKLIAMILSPVSTDKITPFFDILCSYLKCAMTHIDSNIQEDSLLLLDNLLATVPNLIAQNSMKILPNFFDLISKLKNDSKPGRTLTVSLGNKITGIKWRIKVLNRLYSILDAIISEKIDKNKNSRQNSTLESINFDPDKCMYIPIHKLNCLQPSFTLNEINSTSKTENFDELLNYVDTLVPLLFDSWLEVGPGTKIEENNLDSTLNEEAVTVLNCSLNILLLLWRFIDIYQKDTGNIKITDSFLKKYSKDFTNYILKLFPFNQTGLRKRKHNEKELIDIGCTNENLMICSLFCIFNKKISNDIQIEYAKKIAKYIQGCLLHKTHINSQKQLFSNLKLLLVEVSKSWTDSNLDLTNILNSTINYYDNTKLSESSKYELFNILCEVVHLNYLNKTPNFQIWLSKLPELLLQEEISEKNVDLICLLAKQNNKLFLYSLVQKYEEILRNLSKLKISNCENKYPVLFKIIGLFYYVPVFEKNNLDILKTIILGTKDEKIKELFINLLKMKYEIKQEDIVHKYLCTLSC